ncbi:MAG: Asp23/Gls24 family envelope stress response protein [Actinobacteria bacterium]|nr:Asp23/Gls24 family envelope stress response protein [Actinomycetota bacterium]
MSGSLASTSASGGSELLTEKGKTSIADSVVTKIAGMAAREVSGVHNMGAGGSRAIGGFVERLPMGGSQPSPSQGVKVEVGERQAAVDVDIVTEYGVSIVDVAQAVRDNIIDRVESMSGLQVTEVNVTVDDIYIEQPEEPAPPPPEPRVQ